LFGYLRSVFAKPERKFPHKLSVSEFLKSESLPFINPHPWTSGLLNILGGTKSPHVLRGRAEGLYRGKKPGQQPESKYFQGLWISHP
jgi:hypothetical protein